MRGVRVLLVLAAASGCGDDDCCKLQGDAALDAPDFLDAPVDGPPANAGFIPPSAPLAAYSETSPDTFVPASLDLSCFGVARNDAASTATVSIMATVQDFQSGNVVPSASIEAFANFNYAVPFATATSDSGGQATFSIPSGTKRYGTRIASSNSTPTYALDLLATSAPTTQTRTLYSMSNATVATLPALVGETQMTGKSIILGRLSDCVGHPMSNFIATISNTAAIPDHVVGVHTYYFSASVGLPVRNSSAAAADKDGRFMILHVPATNASFIQMWGYLSAQDEAAHDLKLIAELQVSLIAGSAYFTEHDPRATH